ncbi:MAG TPA: ATP-binding protein [Fibrobacteres bacterium]|nr:ATP-binding protein [Fibrobacterota bacterium]
MLTLQEIRNNPDKYIPVLKALSYAEKEALFYSWRLYARPEQVEPEGLGKNGKFIWLAKCGRGFGKTRMFSEWVIEKARWGGYKNISLVGAAADEVRMIQIEGESGILACSPRNYYPNYQPSKKELIWPNGAKAQIFYGTEPEKARGAQSDLIWGDELCKWKYPQETLDNLLMGLRLGKNPLCGISTTPKPTKTIRELVKRADIIVTGGSTLDNAINLAGPFMQTIIAKYKGTRLEKQEIFAQILEDNPNALWHRDWIDNSRVASISDLDRIVVAIDPAASHDEEGSNETGIIVAGKRKENKVDHYYILDDVTIIGTPEQWANRAISAYNKWGADKIVAEKNNGGDMVESTLHNSDKTVPVKLVWASRGKITRAEPISLLYEQGRCHHVGTFEALEDQMCEYVPGDDSPDRMDALVWAITEIMSGFTSTALDANGKAII